MTALFSILALVVAIVVTLVTSLQILYLESLRIRARAPRSVEFFKEHIEARLKMETERGALTFSLLKHAGLAVVGCLTLAATEWGSVGWQGLIAAIVISGAYAVVGTYTIPQILYRKSNGHWLAPLIPLFRLLAILIRPIAWAIEFMESLFELNGAPADAPEHIDALISAGEEEGIIEKGDRELIESVVAFGDKTVREAMTPRPKIVAIREDASLEELRELAIREQYSRIPVYENTLDQITGFVHVRDMFELDDEQRKVRKVREIMRPILRAPETKPVNDLFREMQEEGAHMAVVISEYGSTAGIVTLEDLVEEIVGEIHDEHEAERDFREEPDGSYVVSGSFDLGRLEDLLDFHPQEDTESTTVGGLITEWLGHVPAAGEETERDGITIRVLAANDLRVDQVRVAKAAAK